MDRLEKKPMDERLALRLRYLELMELEEQGKTKCDACESIVNKGDALEMWKGNVCLYVACFGCLRSRHISIAMYPDGLHIQPQSPGSTGLIRTAESLLPSSNRPMLSKG